jgi:uncharacterized protein
MTTRRGFLAGLLAAGLTPGPSWADLGGPAFLSAAKTPDGSYLLAGLSTKGAVLFSCPLPDRGHAAAAHPQRPEAVAFARRPGRFADVINCQTGARLARLQPPPGHHFYGHGVFTPDGTRLFTTENDYENGRGIVGVWEAEKDYRRLTSFCSGGIGPHDMLLRQHRGQMQLAIANGGIETHPDSGRAKLNLPQMRPNLSLLSLDGQLQDKVELPTDLHLNSIRHLAQTHDGALGFAMQWQGDLGEDVPIVGLYRPGAPPHLLAGGDPRRRNLQGYGGSLAFSADGSLIAVTSPRGGVVQVMETTSGRMRREYQLRDVCGLITAPNGFISSSGDGRLFALEGPRVEALSHHGLAWDNHLIRLS